MYKPLIVVHILICLTIIGLVLLQQGRGADAGTGLGGGASGTLFGARGTTSFLSRTTAIFAALFFASSLLLAYLGSKQDNGESDIIATQPSSQAQTKDDLPSPSNVEQAEDNRKVDVPEPAKP